MVLLLSAGFAYAQTATITGQVTDADTGEPLPGANVAILELETGTVADLDGSYTISNIDVRTAPYELRASFTGFTTTTQEVVLSQADQVVTVNFALTPGIELDDIVVTALGIERSERELGYSISEIRGDEVASGDQSNLIQALSGRIAGLNITQSSGTLGGSSRIVIRGITSLSADNQPLFVVDGVPISNANIAPTQGRLQGTVDTGSRGNDINPADVESVTVLRGGAAAALYGQRAKNGVILITTRRGIDRPRAQVQVSSSLMGQSITRYPDFHNDYSAGGLGYYDRRSTGGGWGAPIQGQEVGGSVMFQDTPTTLTASPDNIRDFFNTGVSATNSVSFSTGTTTSDFRLGVTRIDQGGIVPGSELARTTLSLNAGTRLANDFTARAQLQYVSTSDWGRARMGGNDQSILMPIIFGLPRTMDITELRDYTDEAGNQRFFGEMSNNPYWIINENPFVNEVERVFGAGTVGFDPIEWLNVTARVGTDFYTQNRRLVDRPGTVGAMTGRFTDDIIQSRELNTDIMARVERPITEDFSFQGIIGTNINQRTLQRNTNRSENLQVQDPPLYTYANATQNLPTVYNEIRRLYGFFGDVTLGYQDAVFLNLTGRNDVSSTLPVENRSYFYPSASLSVVFSDLVDLDPNLLSYGKLRLSAARVGSDESPHQLDFTFAPVTQAWSQFQTHVAFPFLGELAAYDGPSTMPPIGLRPQQQTTYEIGAELGFLQDRISLDFTLYDQRTTDQIISLPTARSTGFAAVRTNIGEVSNRGIEATLHATTFEIGDFSHDLRATFGTNQNRVVELAPGVDQIVIEGGYNSLAVRAEPGESLGIYGVGWERDPETGLIVIDPDTGLREWSNDIIRLGGLDPDFRVGFTNTFRYGPFSLNALIDWKQGGSLYSETVARSRRLGLTDETTVNRGGTMIDHGVVCERDEDENPINCRENDVPVTSMQSFWARLHNANTQEAGVFDASYVKLRELSLTFDVPSNLLQQTPFGQAAVTLEARNVALLYSRIPHIDPETNLFGSGTVGGEGYEFNNLPATRTFGVNLSVTF